MRSILPFFIFFLSSPFNSLWAQLFSQYVETESGTAPKGIEIWNSSDSDIVFSSSQNLQIHLGRNGFPCAAQSGTNTTSDTLHAGKVWVMGTSDVVAYALAHGKDLSGTTLYSFSYNGDDALELRLSGLVTDRLGLCGTDPGLFWSGSGVQTANQNIGLKAGILSGDSAGFSDPSERFERLHSSPSTSRGLIGFGDAPSLLSVRDSFWEEPSAWMSGRVPGTEDAVLLRNQMRLNTPSVVSHLKLDSGITLNASASSTLEILKKVELNGQIILEADSSGYSQLKAGGTISGTGSVTIQQYIANAGWHNLAIPVDIASLDDLGDVGDQAGTGAQNTFYWDPSGTPQWVNQTASATDVKGRGYLAYVGTYGIAAAPATLSLTGTPYTSFAPSISYGTGTDQDWNLIANPFTCSLDFNALAVGTSGTNVNNSFAIWDPSADAGNGDYVTVSSISSSSQKIAPLQSFWVQTTGSSPSFPSMSMSTHGTVGSSPTYYKSQSVIADRLFLHTYQASNPQLEDELLIGFIPGASDGNDNAYDAGKRIGNNVAPFLMSAANGDELAINAIDHGPLSAKPKLLQLRFVSAKNNEDYFIALEDSLLTNEYRIVLEDKKLSKRHDLNSRAYRFTHDVTEEYRFVLHLEPLVERLDEHTQVVVAAGSGSGRFFIIYFKDGSSAEPMEGALYDLQGRRVQSFTVPAGQDRVEVSTQDLPTGIYLLKIQTPNGLHAEKILID